MKRIASADTSAASATGADTPDSGAPDTTGPIAIVGMACRFPDAETRPLAAQFRRFPGLPEPS